MKNSVLLLFLTLILFSACKKDVPLILAPDNTISGPLKDYEPDVENITGSLIGQVFKESGAILRNATVRMNGQTTMTDRYGFFSFINVTMNAKGTFVEVEADGYFQGSRRFFPRQGATARVNIKMLRQEFDQSFNAQTDATMSFEGAEVVFSAGSIRTATGQDYTGNVNFSGKWLNPTANDINEIMPGNLQGVNTSSRAVALKTLGMIAVELQDDAGNELNIQTGKTAEIRIPVPTELQNDAPMQIPLWYFNQVAGIWVEEGSATLQNDVYVGEVSHFSFWNCDIPTDYVYLSMQIVGESGTGLNNQNVWIMSQNYGSRGGITDSEGFVSGIVPANELLSCTVSDYSVQCSDYFDFAIEPLAEDTDLGAINAGEADVQVTTISGMLTDCDGNIITNGHLQTIVDNQIQYYHYTGNEFEYTFTNCYTPSSWTLIGLDLINQTNSAEVEVITGTDNNFNSIPVCEELSEFDYVSVNVDGEFVDNYLVNYVYTSGDSTYVSATGNGGDVNFHFPGTVAGDYGDDNSFRFRKNSASYNISGALSEFTVIQATNNRQMGIFSGELENYIEEVSQTVFVEGEFLITPE